MVRATMHPAELPELMATMKPAVEEPRAVLVEPEPAREPTVGLARVVLAEPPEPTVGPGKPTVGPREVLMAVPPEPAREPAAGSTGSQGEGDWLRLRQFSFYFR
jgi:hypothetical protein